MKKLLIVENSELIELLEENFGITAETDVFEGVIDGEEVVKDVVVMTVQDSEVDKMVDKLSDELEIVKSQIIREKCSAGTTKLMVDWQDLEPLINSKYDVELTGKYTVESMDSYRNPIVAFEIC